MEARLERYPKRVSVAPLDKMEPPGREQALVICLAWCADNRASGPLELKRAQEIFIKTMRRDG